MLSNIIISEQKFVFFIDDCGYETFSECFLNCWSKEQNEKLEFLDGNSSVVYTGSIDDIDLKEKKSIVLPSLSKLLSFLIPKKVFKIIDQLKNNSQVKQIFLWATTSCLKEKFFVEFIEYQADLIVHFIDEITLSVLTKKQGGTITKQYFKYKKTSDRFFITYYDNYKPEETTTKPETVATFKIELDEDEIVARNSIKMPYEKVIDDHQNGEGNIIYVPDACDDFDDDDPDEDLIGV